VYYTCFFKKRKKIKVFRNDLEGHGIVISMNNSDPYSLPDDWKRALSEYVETEHFRNLLTKIHHEYEKHDVFPQEGTIFKAFFTTPFSKVSVVIVGQDPYHGKGQAEGFAFSVPKGVQVPPSLKNIYKEIESDLGITKDYSDGHLEEWAKQGVLLLNSILTVRANEPASHRKNGWEEFTDYVISRISEEKENVIFMLWGAYAQSKRNLIDTNKHLILESSHPSPFSAYQGFFGSKHFSTCNDYLRSHAKDEILW
jgi:uracil-DNA glycosylase